MSQSAMYIDHAMLIMIRIQLTIQLTCCQGHIGPLDFPRKFQICLQLKMCGSRSALDKYLIILGVSYDENLLY